MIDSTRPAAVDHPVPARVQRSWRGLWARARPHRGTISAAIALGIVGIAVDLAQPLAAREVINAIGSDRSLRTAVLVLVGLVVAGAAVSATHYFLLERTAENIARDARLRLTERLLRLRVPDVLRFSRGDLLARLGSDTTLLRGATTTGIAGSINGVLSLIGSLVLMGWIDWRLLLVTLGVLAVALVVVAVIVPRIGVASHRGQEAMAELTATMERALTAMRTVKASGAEEREQAQARAAADAAYGHGLSIAKLTAATAVATDLALQVAFLAVLGVGGARIASESLDVGSFIAFLLYLFYLAGPLTQLALGVTQLQAGTAAAARLMEIENLPVESTGPPGSPSRALGGPTVRIEHVSFRYGDERPMILDDVSLEVPANGQTALVGPSGVGKTTIFGLIERFFSPDAGRILFDGKDIAQMHLTELRGQIGYVEQDAPLVGGTMRENLVYGMPDASDSAIADVLRVAQLEEVVAVLPGGIDAPLGDGGEALSGGQRQRVAIARALLRSPRLLLLDEATSQLDAINEAALRATIARAADTCTVIVIAHRLATVATSDRVVVLHDGRVRAVDTHEALINSDMLYRDLVASEFVPTGLSARMS